MSDMMILILAPAVLKLSTQNRVKKNCFKTAFVPAEAVYLYSVLLNCLKRQIIV